MCFNKKTARSSISAVPHQVMRRRWMSPLWISSRKGGTSSINVFPPRAHQRNFATTAKPLYQKRKFSLSLGERETGNPFPLPIILRSHHRQCPLSLPSPSSLSSSAPPSSSPPQYPHQEAKNSSLPRLLGVPQRGIVEGRTTQA